MRRDLRDTAAFRDARALLEEVYRPGEGHVSDIEDLQRSGDPSRLVFTGTLADDLAAPRATRICAVDLDSGAIEMLTAGPGCDRQARASPDGKTIAFLSDRDPSAGFQLFLLDPLTHAVSAGCRVDGWVEYGEWSPDGRRLLLGVAGHGADLSSGQGAYTTHEVAGDEPGWMPHVAGSSPESLWRRAWVLEVATGALSCASPGAMNVWEASWCGDGRLAMIASDAPEEGAWYAAAVSLVDLATGETRCVYRPVHQLASPRSSPSGERLAAIEAVASDRGYVAGDLRLLDLRDGSGRVVDTRGVDATCVEWRSDARLLVAGHRGLETVVLAIDVDRDTAEELWSGLDLTTAERHATVLDLPHRDAFAFIGEGFFRRPHIATVTRGVVQVAGAPLPDPPWRAETGGAEAVRWRAPDGLPIEGWLLRPRGEPPNPTILEVHGGPVLHWRPFWLGRAPSTLMLLRRGYAIFLPNPRGSSGRGQEFAARVLGDVGGADTGDLLSGLDHLVAAGLADPSRLGVTGLSYGGFMTCWLTTQDPRFRAAVSVGPATNHVSHHLLCNIPQFVSLFLRDHYTNLAGAYYARSPLLHAHRSTTPTLLVCGALDRCTPVAEATQFHHALQEHGVASAVVTYPEEGHGVHGIPATIDFAARCAIWFDTHIPPAAGEATDPPGEPAPHPHSDDWSTA